MKICTKCKVEKSVTEFNNDKNRNDGKTPHCKTCINLQYTKNRERVLEKQKDYRLNNKVIISQKDKEYYKKHSEIKKAYSKDYRLNNKVIILQKGKEYYKKHSEIKKAYSKDYYEKNKCEILIKCRAYYHRTKFHDKTKRKEWEVKNRDRIRDVRNLYMRQRKLNDSLFHLNMNTRRLIALSIQKQGYSKKSKTYEILGCSYEEFKEYLEQQFVHGMSWDNRHLWHIDHIYPASKALDEEHLIKLNHYTNLQPLWAEDNLKKGNKII